MNFLTPHVPYSTPSSPQELIHFFSELICLFCLVAPYRHPPSFSVLARSTPPRLVAQLKRYRTTHPQASSSCPTRPRRPLTRCTSASGSGPSPSRCPCGSSSAPATSSSGCSCTGACAGAAWQLFLSKHLSLCWHLFACSRVYLASLIPPAEGSRLLGTAPRVSRTDEKKTDCSNSPNSNARFDRLKNPLDFDSFHPPGWRREFHKLWRATAPHISRRLNRHTTSRSVYSPDRDLCSGLIFPKPFSGFYLPPCRRHGIHMGFAHWARSGFYKSKSSIPGRLLNHSYSVMSRLSLAAYTGAAQVSPFLLLFLLLIDSVCTRWTKGSEAAPPERV